MHNLQTPLLSSALLSASMMTPIERQQGRFLRAPDHPAAGGDGGSTGGGDGNNGGGNNGQSGNDSTNQNNGGQPLDLNAFWNGEPDKEGAPPSGESDGKPASSGSSPNPNPNPQPNIGEQIQAMNFGDFMTPDVIEQMGNGDMTGFNTGIQNFGQTVMRQTLALSVGIMKQLREQIFAEVDGKIEGRVTGDRQYDALVAAIPSAGKPEMGPTIKNIYARALTNSKGNVDKAIEQTKQVLQLQAEAFGGDLGLNVAPKGPADYTPPKTTNWLESLAAN